MSAHGGPTVFPGTGTEAGRRFSAPLGGTARGPRREERPPQQRPAPPGPCPLPAGQVTAAGAAPGAELPSASPRDPGTPTGPGAAAERLRTLCRAAAARPLPARCLAEGDGAWRRSPWQWAAWAEWSGPQRGGERAREGGSARPRPSPAPRCLRRAAAAERPPARPGRGARTHRAEGRAPRCPRRAPWAARRAAERARRRRRCAAAMAVAVETRPELVGKRFLCVGGGEEPVESGRWRAGVIRAVSQRDSHSPDLAVSGAAGPRRGAAAEPGRARRDTAPRREGGRRRAPRGARGPRLGARSSARGPAGPGGHGGEESRGNVIVSAPFMSAVTARSEARVRARGAGPRRGARPPFPGWPRNARSVRRSRALLCPAVPSGPRRAGPSRSPLLCRSALLEARWHAARRCADGIGALRVLGVARGAALPLARDCRANGPGASAPPQLRVPGRSPRSLELRLPHCPGFGLCSERRRHATPETPLLFWSVLCVVCCFIRYNSRRGAVRRAEARGAQPASGPWLRLSRSHTLSAI